jgi:hypothetical protein
VQIALDNAGEDYWDDDETSGLFNSGRIIWVQLIFYLENDSSDTLFLVFGGTVYLPSVQPVSQLQTVEFLAHGHLKELERYPGFRLTTENGTLPKIPGITLVSVTEPSGGIIESIRDLKFKIESTEIKGLSITGLSSDTPSGWHVIKFQPPDLFQYDFGSWNQFVAAATGQTLTASKGGRGYTLTADMPDVFDIESREDWFYTSSRQSLFYDVIGKFALQYSNGKAIALKPTLDRIIFHDDSGGTYVDIAKYINNYDADSCVVMGGVNDEIWFMGAKDPLVGIYFEIESDLIGTITWYYATAFNSFATMTKTDGTSNLSQSGAVTWAIPADWKPVNNSINSVEYENYYILKAKCTAYTSGSCTIKRVLKHLQLTGDDGSKLVIRTQYENLPGEDREDTVVLRDNSSAVMTPCVLRQNVAIDEIMSDLLTTANYSAGNQSLSDRFITMATNNINVFGSAPLFNYAKKVTCVFYYSSSPTGGSILYLGVEDELWKLDTMVGFTYLAKLDPYVRAADGYYFKLEIRRLALDGNGYLQGIAWKSYFDQPSGGQDYSSDIDKGRRTPAVVFRSTDLLTITEQNKIDATDDSIFYSGEVNSPMTLPRMAKTLSYRFSNWSGILRLPQ